MATRQAGMGAVDEHRAVVDQGAVVGMRQDVEQQLRVTRCAVGRRRERTVEQLITIDLATVVDDGLPGNHVAVQRCVLVQCQGFGGSEHVLLEWGNADSRCRRVDALHQWPMACVSPPARRTLDRDPSPWAAFTINQQET